MTRIQWTIPLIHHEALKHSHRWEFQKLSPKAYGAAVNRNVLDSVCSHMTAQLLAWTEKTAFKEALKYASRSEFKKGAGGAYNVMKKCGLLDKSCSHMKSIYTNWTKKSIHAEALKFNGRSEFALSRMGAYKMASKWNIIDEVCSHMPYSTVNGDNDCLYMWQVPNTTTYKVGITSWKSNIRRIHVVARNNSVGYKVIGKVKVQNAVKIEQELLRTYTNKEHGIYGEGYTEFRVLTLTEVIEILDYMKQEALETGCLNYPSEHTLLT